MAETKALTAAEERSKKILAYSKALTAAKEGKAEASSDNEFTPQAAAALMVEDMEDVVKTLENLRTSTANRRAIEQSFGQYVNRRWGFGYDEKTGMPNTEFWLTLGVDPGNWTMDQLFSTDSAKGYRWLVPEIFREAINLGLRRQAIYPRLTSAMISINQPTTTMPFVNMMDAMPKRLSEASSIPMGTISFQQKTVTVSKYGRGIEVSDEVLNFVQLNLVSKFIADVGVKLGMGLDTMAIDTLVNGDQSNGDEAAPIIGVDDTGTGFTYLDLIVALVREGRLGRQINAILTGENSGIKLMMLEEFRKRWQNSGNQPERTLNTQTPVPQTLDHFIHGAVDADQAILVDSQNALIQLTAQNLRVESDRIVERQLSGTYATITTGFANLFRDGRVIVDQSLDIATNTWPSWMDVDAHENIVMG